MSRNFGVGTRDLKSAGHMLLKQSVSRQESAFTTEGTLASRWTAFSIFAKASGVGRLERIDKDLIIKYGNHLKNLIMDEELSIATAQNYISVINTVMRSVTKWTPITAVRDCGLQKRSFVRVKAPVSIDQMKIAFGLLYDQGLIRQYFISRICLEFGLRSKEACLLNTKFAYQESISSQLISVRKGTKGGRYRCVPITTQNQILLLKEASEYQGKSSNLTPVDQSWAVWKDGGLRRGRDVLINFGATGYHELRTIYACVRYKSICGHDAVCIQGSRVASKEQDQLARQIISTELGHSRIEITTSYLGSMK